MTCLDELLEEGQRGILAALAILAAIGLTCVLALAVGALLDRLQR